VRHDLDALREAIREASDPMVVMERVVEQTLLLIPAASDAAIELAHARHLTTVCGAGTLAARVGRTLPTDGSLSGLAVRTGDTLYAGDFRTDRRVNPAVRREVDAGSMICVPLRRELGPIGILKVCARRPHAFQGTDIAVLSMLADFISAIIGASWEVADAAAEVMRGTTPLPPFPFHGHSSASDRSSGTDGDVVGRFVAGVLCPDVATGLALQDQIARVCARREFTMVGQPIVNIDTGEVLGVEALARFGTAWAGGPEECFRQARRLGLAVQLELAAAEVALDEFSKLPDDAFLAINVGPETIASGEFQRLLAAHQPERIVIELTEHMRVDDYNDFRSRIEAIRALGTRLAIDDTGAGFSSLAHILNLSPDLIKLDRLLVRGIDQDPARRAVAQSLISLAKDTGAAVVAEGIETSGELETIRRFGFRYAQGYLLARPAPIELLPSSFPHVRFT
jgi:EAL domain-containing protein (putative c-di-GMP-specific phosphodiesterase class I)